MSLTRGNELLNNLKAIKYFSFLKKVFFTSKNDIMQTIIINKINLLIKDNSNIHNLNANYKWFSELLINPLFINNSENHL